MPKKTIQPQDKYVLRLPDGMRDRIKLQADRNGRSMNAEIVQTLEERYPAPSPIFNTLPHLDISMCILHWRPEENEWAYVDFDDWMAFKALDMSAETYSSLPNVNPGINTFVVAVSDPSGLLLNVIPHKYNFLSNGAHLNFLAKEISDEEENEYHLYKNLSNLTDEQHKRMVYLEDRIYKGQLPPLGAIPLLRRKLPSPARDSAAERFFAQYTNDM